MTQKLRSKQARLTEVAKDTSYVDAQIIAGLRTKVSTLKDIQVVDRADLSQNLASIVRLEALVEEHSCSLGYLKNLDIVGRLLWVLFGFDESVR